MYAIRSYYESGENFATVAAEKSIVMLEDRVQVQVTINPEQKDQAAALIKQSGGEITGVSNRITSYNVCYTKLLRTMSSGAMRSLRIFRKAL